jgi:cell division protein FtsZ
MFDTIELDHDKNTRAKIKVVGVGGAGGNAVNRMVSSGFSGVEFISINTDAMALENSDANTKITLGSTLTKGLGAGAKPEVGHDAILESREEVKSALEGADMVFITAGMGGGTGTGAAPIVAEMCRELDILSVAVVTRPFLFEGPIRTKNSLRGLDSLTSQVDTIITIHNQKILSIADNNMSMKDAFASADDVLIGAVRGISEIILKHGEIQVDFADVKTIMTGGGDALMGTGLAEGENRAVVAAQKAIHSPLLDDIHIQGASGILVNITGGENMGILEINEAMSYIYNEVGEDNVPNIIFGTVINSELNDEIQVTVIATGFVKNGEGGYDSSQGIFGNDYQSANVASQVAPVTNPISMSGVNSTPSPMPSNTSPAYSDDIRSPHPLGGQHGTHSQVKVDQLNQTAILSQPVYTQEIQVAEMRRQGVIAQPNVLSRVQDEQLSASQAERSELQFENELASVSFENDKMIVEEVYSEEKSLEEPIAVNSGSIVMPPRVKTAFLEEEKKDVREIKVSENTWNPELDQVSHPSPESVPAYLRQDTEASPQPINEANKGDDLPHQKAGRMANFDFSKDIDDDYETPAFLRSQDF